jgi:hypothetical protein
VRDAAEEQPLADSVKRGGACLRAHDLSSFPALRTGPPTGVLASGARWQGHSWRCASLFSALRPARPFVQLFSRRHCQHITHLLRIFGRQRRIHLFARIVGRDGIHQRRSQMHAWRQAGASLPRRVRPSCRAKASGATVPREKCRKPPELPRFRRDRRPESSTDTSKPASSYPFFPFPGALRRSGDRQLRR